MGRNIGVGVDHITFRFLISCLVPDIFALKVGSCVKSAQILHVFWPPKFIRGGLLEFLDLHYKVHPDINHVTKFHGDRPRDLGDHMANFKKHHESTAPGGLMVAQ